MSRPSPYSATGQKSVQDAIKSLSKFLKKLDTIPMQELQASAQTIKENAIAQTPYRTGKLERSVYVIVSKDKRRPGLRAGASAVNSDTGFNYAGVQHENTEFNHPIKGKAHFISDPFNEEIEHFKARLRRRLKFK